MDTACGTVEEEKIGRDTSRNKRIQTRSMPTSANALAAGSERDAGNRDTSDS
jgi:hypothetical protein